MRMSWLSFGSLRGEVRRQSVEIERLRLAIVGLEQRLSRQADESRNAITALFELIETRRRDDGSSQ